MPLHSKTCRCIWKITSVHQLLNPIEEQETVYLIEIAFPQVTVFDALLSLVNGQSSNTTLTQKDPIGPTTMFSGIYAFWIYHEMLYNTKLRKQQLEVWFGSTMMTFDFDFWLAENWDSNVTLHLRCYISIIFFGHWNQSHLIAVVKHHSGKMRGLYSRWQKSNLPWCKHADFKGSKLV